MIQSPITESQNVKLIKTISAEYIIKRYWEKFNISVKKYFDNTQEIKIYQCNDTGYRFYYPFNIIGDSTFYEELQQFDWYYMPWKWEHQKASNYIFNEAKVLEIGCGQGDFLLKINQMYNVNTVGIDTNKKAVKTATKNNLHIVNASIDSFSEQNIASFDIICAFQVAEHIPLVKPFITKTLQMLKRKGLLIISVPNNNSFTKYDWKEDILNMPPHHSGLWTKSSLEKLALYFNLNIKAIHKEPLQSYHINWYKNVLERRINKINFIEFFYKKTKLYRKTEFFIHLLSEFITGHTILSIYKKP